MIGQGIFKVLIGGDWLAFGILELKGKISKTPEELGGIIGESMLTAFISRDGDVSRKLGCEGKIVDGVLINASSTVVDEVA